MVLRRRTRSGSPRWTTLVCAVALGGCASPSDVSPALDQCLTAIEPMRVAAVPFVTTEEARLPREPPPPPGARALLTADAATGKLWSLDLATGTRTAVASYERPCPARCPPFDLGGDLIAVVGTDLQHLRLFSRATGAITAELSTPGAPIVDLKLDVPAGIIHLVVGGPTTRLATFPLGGGPLTLGGPALPGRLAFEPGSSHLWIRGAEERLDRLRLGDDRVDASLGSLSLRPLVATVERGRGRLAVLADGVSDVLLFDEGGRRPQSLVALPRFGDACPLPAFSDLALDPATGDVFVAETLCHHPGAVFRLREGLPPEPLEGVPSDGPLVLDFAAPPAAQKSLATPSSPRSFAACADRPDVECGSLVVPLDWTDPSRGTLELRVVLAPALGADRLGVLAYDLGGPGLSNTEALLTAFPDDLVAGSGATLRGHFDLVALERRGTAHSVPALACSFADGPTLPRRPTPEALAPLLTWATGAATSCRQDPLAAHVDSASVARDLDALREALGEEDLSFLGMSYGTTVGEAYARLFPERVRAFVLVSPMHPRQDQLARVFARTAVEEEGFDAFVAWCAEAGSPACALAAPGEGPAEVRARFDAALAAAGPRRAAVLAELRQRNLFPVRHWREVARRLTGHLCGDPSALPRLLGEDLPARKTGDDETLVANFYAVHALDRPFPQGFDSAALTDAAAWLDQRYPLVGDRVLLGMAPLVGWPPGPPLPSGPTRAPPLLVVTSRGDFATPRDDADAVVAGLGNGSHLLEAQGAGHAVVSSNDCAGNVVTDFLVAPNEAPARTTCPSIPAARWRP